MAAIGKDLSKAKELLLRGELVAIPTETVYGLAADATNANAVTKIFSVKNRPTFDPLIVHVADAQTAERYVEEIPAAARLLIQTFWPGPLTLLLKKKPIIPDLVTSGLDTVGIRCPLHSLTKELLQSLPFPLAAPSANPFGYISPTTPLHVNDQLGNKIQYILDGGPCTVGIESTIVGFEKDRPIVYRMGGASVEDIEKIIGPVRIELNTSSNPKSPGQLKSHYAPLHKLVVGELAQLIDIHREKEVGIIAFQKKLSNKTLERQIILSPSGKLEEAAQNLFSALRKMDQLPIDIILAEEVPNRELGRAINDRLRRAASER